MVLEGSQRAAGDAGWAAALAEVGNSTGRISDEAWEVLSSRFDAPPAPGATALASLNATVDLFNLRGTLDALDAMRQAGGPACVCKCAARTAKDGRPPSPSALREARLQPVLYLQVGFPIQFVRNVVSQ